MPTILDTLGIATCSVSYGKESSFAGTLANVAIKIVPKARGVAVLRLNWAATGDMFSAFADKTTGGAGTPGIIVLPQTGQTGFRHGSAAFKDWYYEAVVTADLADGQQLVRKYRFSIPSGQTTLDLDTLDEDGAVTALPSSVPFAAEPSGLSDTTRASLAAAVATAVEAAVESLQQQIDALPAGGAGTAGVLFDTDGVPYLSIDTGTAIQLDTDGVPYLTT